MDDLDSGLERERPDVLEALRSMNWEERLEKARAKRKAALSRRTPGTKAPVLRGAEAAEMARRAAAEPVVLPPVGDGAHPAPVDERTLRGQTPVVSPGLQPVGRVAKDEHSAPPVAVAVPSGLIAADRARDVRREPVRERSVAARVWVGFGFGLGIGMSAIVAALVVVRGGPGEILAAFAPAEAPVVAAASPGRPPPEGPGAAPDAASLPSLGAAPGAAAGVPLAEPAAPGGLPARIFTGGSPEIATAAPLLGGPAAETGAPGILRPESGGAAAVAPGAAPVLAGPGSADARPEAIRPAEAPVLSARAPALAEVAVPEERAQIAARAVAAAAPAGAPVPLTASGGRDGLPREESAPVSAPPAIAVTLVSFEAPAAITGGGGLSAAIGMRPAVFDPAQMSMPAQGRDPGLELAALAPPEAPLASLVPGGDRVSVHLNAPQTVPEGEIDSVTAGLAEAGVSLSEVRKVPFKVSETQVRYFHAEDAPAAGALADLFAGRARDFTGFRPTPPDGTLEVYLAGEAVAPPPRVRTAPQRAQPSAADLLRDRIVQRLRRGDHL